MLPCPRRIRAVVRRRDRGRLPRALSTSSSTTTCPSTTSRARWTPGAGSSRPSSTRLPAQGRGVLLDAARGRPRRGGRDVGLRRADRRRPGARRPPRLLLGRMDHWYEEDEEVFVHARDPFNRVDAMRVLAPRADRDRRRRRGRVAPAEAAVRDGLPHALLLPAGRRPHGLLAPSDRVTACPYKGRAYYYSAAVGDKRVDDSRGRTRTRSPSCRRSRG